MDYLDDSEELLKSTSQAVPPPSGTIDYLQDSEQLLEDEYASPFDSISEMFDLDNEMSDHPVIETFGKYATEVGRGFQLMLENTYNLGSLALGYEPTDYFSKNMPEPESFGQSLARVGGQFIVPYTGFAKVLSPLAKGAKMAGYARTAAVGKPIVAGAATDFVAMTPNDPSLAAILKEHTELEGPILDFLATDPNDAEAMNRIRHVIDGMALGITSDALLRMVGKGFRLAFPKVAPEASPGAMLNSAQLEALKKAREHIDYAGDKNVFRRMSDWYKQWRSEDSKRMAFVQWAANWTLGGKKLEDVAKKLGIDTDITTNLRLYASRSAIVEEGLWGGGPARLMQYGLRKDGRLWSVISEEGQQIGPSYSTKRAANYALRQARNNADILADTTRGNLLSYMEPITAAGSNEMRNFGAWMFAKRMKHVRDKLGKEVPWDDDMIEAALANGDNARWMFKGEVWDYARVAEGLETFNKSLLDYAEQSGILNKATKQWMLEQGLYVPLYRAYDPEAFGKVNIPGRAHKRAGTKGALSLRLRGDKEFADMGDPIENLFRNYASIIEAAEKNRAKLAIYDTIEEMRQTGFSKEAFDFATPEEKLLEIFKTPSKNVADTLSRMGVDVDMTNLPEELVPFFRKALLPQGLDIDIVFRDGKAHAYRMKDPRLAATIGYMGPKEGLLISGNWLRAFSFPKNLLTKAVTLSPPFVARNMIRDSVSSWIMSNSNNFRAFYGPMAAVVDQYRNSPVVREFVLNGGGNTLLFKVEGGPSYKRLMRLYAEQGVNPNQLLNPTNLFRKWTDLVSSMEQANRIEEFKGLIKDGMTRRQAALGGREVATDFGLHGSGRSVRTLNAMIPFFNAGIQSMYRFGRAMGKDEYAARHWMKAALALTPVTYAFYQLNKDDPRYAEIPDVLKDINWIVHRDSLPDAIKDILPKPGPNDKYPGYYFIPKPYDWGMLASFAERFFQSWDKQNPGIVAATLPRLLGDMFRFGGVQTIDPLWDVYITNRTWSGAPIMPDTLQGVDPELQRTPYTSPTAVWMADKIQHGGPLKLSPIEIEYMWKAYFGTIGAIGLEMADRFAMHEALGYGPPVEQSTSEILNPLMKSEPIRQTQDQIDFYNIYNFIKGKDASLKHLESTMGTVMFSKEQIEKWLAKDEFNASAGNINSFLLQVKQASGSIDEAVRLEAISDKTSEEKRKTIDSLIETKNELFRRVMEQVRTNPELQNLEKYKLVGITAPLIRPIYKKYTKEELDRLLRFDWEGDEE